MSRVPREVMAEYLDERGPMKLHEIVSDSPTGKPIDIAIVGIELRKWKEFGRISDKRWVHHDGTINGLAEAIREHDSRSAKEVEG